MQEKSFITELTSRTIDVLRFPLAFMVVILHVPYLFPLPFSFGVKVFWNVFNQNLARLAVPAFFLISGYLFFLKIQDYNISVYFAVLRRKCKTLLLPYLIFCAISFFCKFLLVKDTTLLEFYKSLGGVRLFIDCGYIYTENWRGLSDWAGAFPINGALWYMRDLIIMVVLSPVVWTLLKRSNSYCIVVLTLIYIVNPCIGIPHISAICMFSLGAYFSINKKDLISEFRKIPVFIYMPLMIAMMIFQIIFKNLDFVQVLVIFGLIAIFNITSLMVEREHIHPIRFLSVSSFFIYAMHDNIVVMLQSLEKQGFQILVHYNALTQTLQCVLMPIFVTIILLVMYWLLYRYASPVLALLMGGRNMK